MKKLLLILLAAGLLVSSSVLDAADGDPRGTKRGREDADNASAASGEAPAPSEKAARLEVPPIISLVALKPGDDGTDEFKNRSHVVALDLTTTELYKLLDIKHEDERDAEVIKAKIKALKRSLLLAWHPDKATDSAFANEICKQIIPLINFLSMVLVDNANLKHTYDAKLSIYRKGKARASAAPARPAPAPMRQPAPAAKAEARHKYSYQDVCDFIRAVETNDILNVKKFIVDQAFWPLYAEYQLALPTALVKAAAKGFVAMFNIIRSIVPTVDAMRYNCYPVLASALCNAVIGGHIEMVNTLLALDAVRATGPDTMMFCGEPVLVAAFMQAITSHHPNNTTIVNSFLAIDAVRAGGPHALMYCGSAMLANALSFVARSGNTEIFNILFALPALHITGPDALMYKGNHALAAALIGAATESNTVIFNALLAHDAVRVIGPGALMYNYNPALATALVIAAGGKNDLHENIITELLALPDIHKLLYNAKPVLIAARDATIASISIARETIRNKIQAVIDAHEGWLSWLGRKFGI